jgi:hypothetical protein
MKYRLPLISAVALCVRLMRADAATPAPMTILAGVGNENPSCRVVISTNATECERYAADEAALFLGRMLGTNMGVSTEQKGDTGWTIRLKADEAMGPDSYRIQMKSAKRELWITGGQPRGVLMGVYGLLADSLGCRWYTPDIDYIPAVTRLQLPSRLDVKMTPRLEYRGTDWAEAGNPDWAARNRVNALSGLGPKHGGGISFTPFVHTFNSIIGPGEFTEHPEYFSMIGGVRTANAQLCLSNTNVLNRAIAAARQWAAINGGSNILSVSANDCEGGCECPECKAIYDEEGGHSGALIRFVNKIGEAIEGEFPHATVETLAYLHTRKPPAKTKPRRNVIVRLCSIECCFAHPLETCTEKCNQTFISDLRGWNKMTDRLYIWDYTTDFSHYLMPFPNLDSLDDNMRTFVNNGVKGMFEEGPYIPDCELAELRTWLIVQLMWNPELDSQTLQREFVAGVYGPCAKVVQEFLDLLRESHQKAGDHVWTFAMPGGKKFLNRDVMRACDAKLEEAEQIAKTSGNTALMRRITHLRMPIWDTQFMLGEDVPSVVRTAARRLFEAARQYPRSQEQFMSAPWSAYEQRLERAFTNYPFAMGDGKSTPMVWGPASSSPFLGSVLFRNGANSFGVWDTGFDDRQGTMEAWVFCGAATKDWCKGAGALFDIRGTDSNSGHRVWVDVDLEKGAFIPKYETWANGVTNRIAGEPMTTGAWHHVSATWEADGETGSMNLYTDAQPVGKATYIPTKCRGEILFYVGLDFSSGTGTATCFGPIDEVRLSDVVRKPALQTAVYETDANTRVLLHFDEPVGETIKDSSGLVR